MIGKRSFIKLLMQHFGLGIKWRATSPSGVPLTDHASVENTPFIPLEELIFEADSRYLPTYGHTHTSTPEQVHAATEQLVRLGKNHGVPIPPPLPKALDSMNRLAHSYGIPKFIAVGREFLAQCGWFEESDDRVIRLMRGQEWERFCSNFSVYSHDLEQRRAREAAEDEQRRLSAEEIASRRKRGVSTNRLPNTYANRSKQAGRREGRRTEKRDNMVDRLALVFREAGEELNLPTITANKRALFTG